MAVAGVAVAVAGPAAMKATNRLVPRADVLLALLEQCVL